MARSSARCFVSVLLLCLLFAHPAYAFPITVIDPTKRSFAYDPNGNLTEELRVSTGEATRYTYDPLNRLTGVSSLRGGEAPEAISSFAYDGEGKRVSLTESGATTRFLYDGLLQILERQGSSTTALNVWGLSYGGGIGGLLARMDFTATDPTTGTSPKALYPLYDGSGNILAWSDSTGAVVSTRAYTAFGEIVSSSLQGGAEAIPFGFSTKAFSSATGLSYFGARYYSPNLSRWLTPDPLGQLDGPNLYAFVGNNPINWFDPFGLKAYIAIALSAGGGVGFVGGEGGEIFALDPDSGKVHVYGYGALGPGLSVPVLAGSVNIEAGIIDMDTPADITGFGLAISGFAAAGKGVAGQYAGTGPFGNGSSGVTGGLAAGVGAGVSGLVTYTWLVRTYELKNLPPNIARRLKEALTEVKGKLPSSQQKMVNDFLSRFKK